MTRHPAAPRHPFTDPADLRQELDDLHGMAREAGFPGPLRDVVAHLLKRDRTTESALYRIGFAMNDLDTLHEGLTR